MIVRLALWSLADSMTTVGELRRQLRDEAAADHAELDGLRLKLWLSDDSTERWGFVELYDTREEADVEPADRAQELIGKPPEVFEEFDLEGSVEGRSAFGELSRLGLAFDA